MRLDSYISDLLYRYECVILPGFGAFLTQYQPARIHESTDAFYPPSKLLSFNRQLQSNDGLLADHIAKSKDISYADALTAIRSYTRFLEHELEAGKNIIIEAVGSLAMEAGKISCLAKIAATAAGSLSSRSASKASVCRPSQRM